MQGIDRELTASQVLRVFHHDELRLFLGAAFVTVGLVAGAFCVLRRKFDALLVWLGLFAILYGARLWLLLPTSYSLSPAIKHPLPEPPSPSHHRPAR